MSARSKMIQLSPLSFSLLPVTTLSRVRSAMLPHVVQKADKKKTRTKQQPTVRLSYADYFFPVEILPEWGLLFSAVCLCMCVCWLRHSWTLPWEALLNSNTISHSRSNLLTVSLTMFFKDDFKWGRFFFWFSNFDVFTGKIVGFLWFFTIFFDFDGRTFWSISKYAEIRDIWWVVRTFFSSN